MEARTVALEDEEMVSKLRNPTLQVFRFGDPLLVSAALIMVGGSLDLALNPSLYHAHRFLNALNAHAWLYSLGFPVRCLAILLLMMWGLPGVLALLAFRDFFRHLASGQALRPGLSRPMRTFALGFLLAFVATNLARIPAHPDAFSLSGFQWVWMLRSIPFLLGAVTALALARVLDEAIDLQAEQELVI